MILLFLFLSQFAFAKEPVYWAHVLEVTDRHEFYQNHENILKPANAWQTLFALGYLDSELKKLKDCVYLKVPGESSGILKLKTVAASATCEDHLLEAGDQEVQDIKTFQFSIYDKKVNLEFTTSDFKSHKWQASLQYSYVKPEPEMSMSSAEYKAPKLIFLAPSRNFTIQSGEEFLKDGTLCHNVNEDCEEVSSSSCSQCSGGWYEIPNGCENGPKYCGVLKCGGKDLPACRRGMKWQRTETDFDCRVNSSFAYCSEGFKITCEGKKAFCR